MSVGPVTASPIIVTQSDENDDEDAVMEPAQALFANDAFYLAFRERDLVAMESLWARRTPVACIHPGWSALTQLTDVLESWEAILSNPESPHIVCRGAAAYPCCGGSYVICYEAVGESLLVATNIFIEEDGETRMILHQAGQSIAPPEGLPEEPDQGPLQ